MRRFPFTFKGQSINFFNPNAGLGNRLIPMGCILHLATELNYRPVIFWVQEGVVGGAGFGDLFEAANLPFELVEGREASIMRHILDNGFYLNFNSLERMGFRLFRTLILSLNQYRKSVRLQTGIYTDLAKFRDRSAPDLDSGRKHVILTNRYFRYSCDLGWLKPAPQITSRIVELKKRFAPHTVGVHLRLTDLSNRTVPGVSVEKMIAQMRAEMELNPDVKFFFASDGDKEEVKIISLFGDRLIRSPEHAPRRTLAGQQDAVVDLFGLAATSRIIGMRHSTFATLAALVGNKPLLRII